MPGYIWTGSAWKKVLRKTMWTGNAWKDIKSSHHWTGTAWEMIYSSFTPSRMLKSGAHAVTSTTFAQIAGWVADSSIPGSSVVDNALIANGSSTEDIVALIPYTGGGYGNTTYVELRKNGIAIGSGDFKSNGAGTVTITVPDHSFLGGDAFTLWARRSNFNVNIAPATTRVAIG